MTAWWMALAGALAGGGVLLMVRGMVGTTEPLAALVAELHRPRHGARTLSRRTEVADRLAGRRTAAREADLAVCDRSLERYVRDRFVWALLGATPGALFVLLVASGLASWLSPAVALLSLIGGAIGGWVWARVDLHSDAEKARRSFRHALAAYLELVAILMAGGAGVETSLFDAAAVGRGPEFRHLRASMSAAQARREPPWRLLGELGNRLGITELEELHASMTLAGDGAQVRDSLAAKAGGLRLRDLNQLESEAQARSETMVLPVALMFAGFLLLIGYPALAALSTT
jgi:Flp pilus assembly protein TadB